MRWPWQRRAPASPAEPAHEGADAAAEGADAATKGPGTTASGTWTAGSSPSGWAFHPPLQRTIAPDIAIHRGTGVGWTATGANPLFTGTMTHLVSGSSYSGVVDGDGGGLGGGTAAHVPAPLAAPTPPAATGWRGPAAPGESAPTNHPFTRAASAPGLPVLRYAIDTSAMPLVTAHEPAVQRAVADSADGWGEAHQSDAHQSPLPAGEPPEAATADPSADSSTTAGGAATAVPPVAHGWVNPDVVDASSVASGSGHDGDGGTVVEIPLPAGHPARVQAPSSAPPVQRSAAGPRRLGLGAPITGDSGPDLVVRHTPPAATTAGSTSPPPSVTAPAPPVVPTTVSRAASGAATTGTGNAGTAGTGPAAPAASRAAPAPTGSASATTRAGNAGTEGTGAAAPSSTVHPSTAASGAPSVGQDGPAVQRVPDQGAHGTPGGAATEPSGAATELPVGASDIATLGALPGTDDPGEEPAAVPGVVQRSVAMPLPPVAGGLDDAAGQDATSAVTASPPPPPTQAPADDHTSTSTGVTAGARTSDGEAPAGTSPVVTEAPSTAATGPVVSRTTAATPTGSGTSPPSPQGAATATDGGTAAAAPVTDGVPAAAVQRSASLLGEAHLTGAEPATDPGGPAAPTTARHDGELPLGRPSGNDGATGAPTDGATGAPTDGATGAPAPSASAPPTAEPAAPVQRDVAPSASGQPAPPSSATPATTTAAVQRSASLLGEAHLTGPEPATDPRGPAAPTTARHGGELALGRPSGTDGPTGAPAVRTSGALAPSAPPPPTAEPAAPVQRDVAPSASGQPAPPSSATPATTTAAVQRDADPAGHADAGPADVPADGGRAAADVSSGHETPRSADVTAATIGASALTAAAPLQRPGEPGPVSVQRDSVQRTAPSSPPPSSLPPSAPPPSALPVVAPGRSGPGAADSPVAGAAARPPAAPTQRSGSTPPPQTTPVPAQPTAPAPTPQGGPAPARPTTPGPTQSTRAPAQPTATAPATGPTTQRSVPAGRGSAGVLGASVQRAGNGTDHPSVTHRQLGASPPPLATGPRDRQSPAPGGTTPGSTVPTSGTGPQVAQSAAAAQSAPGRAAPTLGTGPQGGPPSASVESVPGTTVGTLGADPQVQRLVPPGGATPGIRVDDTATLPVAAPPGRDHTGQAEATDPAPVAASTEIGPAAQTEPAASHAHTDLLGVSRQATPSAVGPVGPVVPVGSADAPTSLTLAATGVTSPGGPRAVPGPGLHAAGDGGHPVTVSRATASGHVRPLPWRTISRPATHSRPRSSSVAVAQRVASTTASTTTGTAPEPATVPSAVGTLALRHRPVLTPLDAAGTPIDVDVEGRHEEPHPVSSTSVQRAFTVGNISSTARGLRRRALGTHRTAAPAVADDTAADAAPATSPTADLATDDDGGGMSIDEVTTEAAAAPAAPPAQGAGGTGMDAKELAVLADALYPRLLRRMRHEILLDRERRGLRTDRRTP